MDNPRSEYLKSELFTLTLQGTVQRSGIYAHKRTENGSKRFRETLRENLYRIAETYKNKVAEDVHIEHINLLADIMSNELKGILREDRFRIGPAQKALNLYLKYMWCLEEIPEPPHCPFDSIIIGQLNNCAGICWTKLDSVEEYLQLVKAAREKAAPKSLAQWELMHWTKTFQRRHITNHGD